MRLPFPGKKVFGNNSPKVCQERVTKLDVFFTKAKPVGMFSLPLVQNFFQPGLDDFQKSHVPTTTIENQKFEAQAASRPAIPSFMAAKGSSPGAAGAKPSYSSYSASNRGVGRNPNRRSKSPPPLRKGTARGVGSSPLSMPRRSREAPASLRSKNKPPKTSLRTYNSPKVTPKPKPSRYAPAPSYSSYSEEEQYDDDEEEDYSYSRSRTPPGRSPPGRSTPPGRSRTPPSRSRTPPSRSKSPKQQVDISNYSGQYRDVVSKASKALIDMNEWRSEYVKAKRVSNLKLAMNIKKKIQKRVRPWKKIQKELASAFDKTKRVSDIEGAMVMQDLLSAMDDMLKKLA